MYPLYVLSSKEISAVSFIYILLCFLLSIIFSDLCCRQH
jgi:hypothetical protein